MPGKRRIPGKASALPRWKPGGCPIRAGTKTAWIARSGRPVPGVSIRAAAVIHASACQKTKAETESCLPPLDAFQVTSLSYRQLSESIANANHHIGRILRKTERPKSHMKIPLSQITQPGQIKTEIRKSARRQSAMAFPFPLAGWKC